jgi:branched-chain amino acid transport system permease protein
MIEYLANLIVLISLYWILATSLDLALGYCGIFSIAQAAFYGLGAYASALLSINLQVAFPFNLLGGVLFSASIAVISSFFLLRLRQDYLALGTLFFGIIIQECLRNWEFLTGGSRGLSGIPSIQIFGFTLNNPVASAIISSIIAGIIVFCLYRLEKSQFGTFLRGVDSDEISLQSLGTDTFQLKIAAFTIAAIGASIAGSLYAHYSMSLDPNRFSIAESFVIISAIALGGKKSLPGTTLGVVILILLPEVLRLLPLSNFKQAALRDVIFSAILIFILIFRPQGIFPRKKALSLVQRSVYLAPANHNYNVISGDNILVHIKHFNKKISSDFSINIQNINLEKGKIYGIVGANGSGKSMFFNILTGVVKADLAEASFDGKNILNFAPEKIARLGISRTFQSVRLQKELTVIENISLVKTANIPKLLWDALFERFSLLTLDFNYARELLNNINLSPYENQHVSELSFGQQKAIEIIRAISSNPQLLLLDEPMSGLSLQVRSILVDELLRLKNTGTTIAIIEHDLDFLNTICDRWIYIKDGSITQQLGSQQDYHA